MAILTSQQHIEVKVIIEDQAAEEYTDHDSEPIRKTCDHEKHKEYSSDNTVVKYIQSISDAVFKIRVSVDKRYLFDNDCTSTSCRVRVDGVRAEGARIPIPTRRGSRKQHIRGWEKRQPDGQWLMLPFKFCPVRAVKGEIIADDVEEEIARNFGTIEVLVCGMNRSSERYIKAAGKAAPSIVGQLSERAMKVRILTHSISAEDQVSIRQPYSIYAKYVDGTNHPIARFIFRYRSREAPQKPHIIETPVYHIDKLSVEELRERYRQSLSMNRFLLANMSDEQVKRFKYESHDSSDK